MPLHTLQGLVAKKSPTLKDVTLLAQQDDQHKQFIFGTLLFVNVS